MKGITAFLFLFVAVASATVIREKDEVRVADKEFLTRQRNLLILYHHVSQPAMLKPLEIGTNYDIESNYNKYTDVQVVRDFMVKYRAGMLPKGRSVSLSYPELTHQTKLLFELLYTAKDYDTFYKTACWARVHCNEQMFIYALSVAVLHRPDCQGLVIPPPYEVTPYYFYNTEVIDQAYKVKMQRHGRDIDERVHHVDDHNVVIYTNYSSWYQNYNHEQKLAYFTEDIGLNTLYYYTHLDYPFWMEGEKYGLSKDGRGEIFYYFHQQLLARYYMERLSNNLGEIPTFSWHSLIETGYTPSLKTSQGIYFPQRPNHYDVMEGEHLTHLIQVEDYERRIREAIDMGYIIKRDGSRVLLKRPEDIEVLASIVESNADCPNPHYYRYSPMIAKMLLGNSHTPLSWDKIHPSSLELYHTSLRDPMFYQLYKRYISYFMDFKNTLVPYTSQELTCPGVKIESVEVDKLVTYFDHFDSGLTSTVHYGKDEATKQTDEIVIKARQTRLNHLPFTVTTNIVSEKPTKVSFRFFIGPKYDGKGDLIHLEENRENLFEIDQFVYDLKSGKNVIERNSRDFWITTDDMVPARVQYEDILLALDGKKEYKITDHVEHNAYPDRLLLPKGRKGGMPFNFYVVITPYHAPQVPYGTGYDKVLSTGVGSGAKRLDAWPLGYPFDRPIDETTFLSYSNIHESTVLIFHKQEADINKAI